MDQFWNNPKVRGTSISALRCKDELLIGGIFLTMVCIPVSASDG